LGNSTDPSINLTGFMVGNGATNWDYDVWPSYPQTVRWFNIIPPTLLQQIHDNECEAYFYSAYKPHTNTATCDALFLRLTQLTDQLNWYDLYRTNYDLAPPSEVEEKQHELRQNRYKSVMIDG